MLKTCDKCGKEVQPENDAYLLDKMAGYGHPDLSKARHILPTEDCEGSPSRAKYVNKDLKHYGEDRNMRLAYYIAYNLMKIAKTEEEILSMCSKVHGN